jgi:DNA polymerase-3 subunit epsilon
VSADWTIRPMLCVDTETTGVNTDNDRVVEVAASTLDWNEQVIEEWSTIIDPGIEIPAEASAVHGISTSKAMAEGRPPAEALADLAALIHEATVAGNPIVVFNATFDVPLLITECHRHGVELFPFAQILDPYLIDRLVDTEQARRAAAKRESFKFRKGRRQLALVAYHYGVELTPDDAHSATPDAVAAGRIMRRIIKKYPEIGDRSLAWLWLRQVRGYEADRERFVDWIRRNRNPDFEKPIGWPIPAAPG